MLDKNKNRFVTQYRAELTLDTETTCTINSTSQQAVTANVRKVLGGEVPRQEPVEGSSTSLIYHKGHFNGDQPVGWMAEIEVPLTMSVRNITENRIAAQKAA